MRVSVHRAWSKFSGQEDTGRARHKLVCDQNTIYHIYIYRITSCYIHHMSKPSLTLKPMETYHKSHHVIPIFVLEIQPVSLLFEVNPCQSQSSLVVFFIKTMINPFEIPWFWWVFHPFFHPDPAQVVSGTSPMNAHGTECDKELPAGGINLSGDRLENLVMVDWMLKT